MKKTLFITCHMCVLVFSAQGEAGDPAQLASTAPLLAGWGNHTGLGVSQ